MRECDDGANSASLTLNQAAITTGHFATDDARSTARIANGMSSNNGSGGEHKSTPATGELARTEPRPICSDAYTISSGSACFHQEHPPALAASRPLQRMSCVN
jgi:hypothetical protein